MNTDRPKNAWSRHMEQPRVPIPIVTVEVHDRYFAAFSPRKLLEAAVVIALLLGCAIAVWQGDWLEQRGVGWLLPVANVGLVLTSVSLGLIFAPTPIPTDYSQVAAISVDAMAELARSTDKLVERLGNLAVEGGLTDQSMARVDLFRVQEELVRHKNAHVQEIARWSRVAPGSEDEIVKGRETGAAILRKLEMEQDE